MATVVEYKRRRNGRGEALDDDDIKALITSEINTSKLYDQTELSQRRADSIDLFNGRIPGLGVMPGRSSYVDRSVADTIGWMLPGVIRVFTASERMVQYNPVGRGDENFADEASDYCNHIFWKDNDGYRVLWNATHDSLVQGNGVVKTYWDDSETCEYSVHTGMTEDDIAILMSAEDNNPVEIKAQRPGIPFQMPDPNWQPDPNLPPEVPQEPPIIEIPTYDIKLERTVQTGRLVIESIAPEDFFLDAEARTLEEARFMGHRAEKTRSELVEMGFAREKVDELPGDRGSRFDAEKLARDGEDVMRVANSALHKSMQLVELWEVYIKVDVDGDGVSEAVRAYFAGNGAVGELLEWEIWDDDFPFQDIPCEPVPHRWDARSITDETADIQKIKTVMSRQLIDNMYWSNTPQMEIEQNSVINPESALVPKFGGVIWKKPGSQPIVPHQPPFVGDKAIMALEYLDQQIEKRTGVSRSTMALDPQTLQNQTATATQKQTDASYSQVELIARNQAELGWKKVFRKILKLVVKHQDRPRQIRLKEDWVDMDPRFWNSEMDCDINVGLGTGSRDRDMQMLQTIGLEQKQIATMFHEVGLAEEALDMLPRIVRTDIKMAESSGIRDPEGYFPDITDEKMAQIQQKLQEKMAQPDPKVVADQQKAEMQAQVTMQTEQAKMQATAQSEQVKAQSAVQVEQAKLQYQAQLREMELQVDMQKEQMRAEVETNKERAQMEADLQVDAAKRETEAILEQQRIQFETWKTQATLENQWNIAVLNAGVKQDAAAQAAAAKQSEQSATEAGA